METALHEEVRTHLRVILGMESGDIREALGRLDQLKDSASGHLAHYLGKRSYQKAWILLEGGDPEKGICGGHHQ